MKAMSDALKCGMVLAMSIWQDSSSNMSWLDSTFPTIADPKLPGVKRGPCSITSGRPADIMANNPDAAVVFENKSRRYWDHVLLKGIEIDASNAIWLPEARLVTKSSTDAKRAI